MRQAFELAWTAAARYMRRKPTVIACDDFSFVAPVDVGSILHLRAQVVYALGEGPRLPARALHAVVTAHAVCVPLAVLRVGVLTTCRGNGI